MSKVCISCGMPMNKPEDFAAGDEAKDYCVHCARADGSLKSYKEALVGMTNFIVQTQGLDESAAGEAAKAMMAKMPAWQNR